MFVRGANNVQNLCRRAWSLFPANTLYICPSALYICPRYRWCFGVHTLCRQWRHVLMRAPVDLVSVRVHGQYQHHDASHNTSGNRTHRSSLDHVQRCHLLIWRGYKDKEAGVRSYLERIRDDARSQKRTEHFTCISLCSLKTILIASSWPIWRKR